MSTDAGSRYDESSLRKVPAMAARESKGGTVVRTVLPSAVAVKEFAEETADRSREQERSHNEYVALLRRNRQKARPVKTAKSYERVQRWWTVVMRRLENNADFL